MLDPYLNQDHYRFRNDDGDEANATYTVAMDTPISFSADSIFRVRISILEENGAVARNTRFGIIQRINGGPWISSSDPPENRALELADSIHIAPGTILTTQQITAGGFTPGQLYDSGGVAVNVSIDPNNYTEFELVMQGSLSNYGASWDAGDTLELALVYEDLTLLDEYSLPPSMTVLAPTGFISKIFLGGDQQSDIKFGSVEPSAIYYGSTQVY